MQQMAVLKLDLWLVASLRKEELIMTRSLLLLPNYFHHDHYLAAVLGWKLHQIDVKTDFLNGKVEQEVISNILRGL